MKKKFCLFLSVLLMFFCFAIETRALTIQLIPSSTKVAPDEEFKLQLLFTNYDSIYTSGNIEINYDSNLFEYLSYVYTGDNPAITVSTSNNIVNVKYNYEGYPDNKIVHVKFKAKSNVADGQSGNFNLNIKSGNYVSTISKEIFIALPSSNADLSSLTLNDGSISPNFDSNILNYTAVVNSSMVKISATKADSEAKITGTGTKTLNYGVNNFNIKVTAEDGTIKIYKLAITRPDDRSSDSSLKNITLSNGSIDFSSSKKDYNVSVTSSSVTVSATKNDDNAKLEYPNGNTVNLGYGESKTIKIKVTAENGSSSTYNITLTRKDTRSNDNSLKNITLSNGSIDFSSSKKDYNVSVTSGSVTVSATKNNANAKLEYLTGNTIYLDYGESKTVKIKVTSEKGTSSIYSITLTRIDTRSNDATLKSLTVSNTNIKFNKSTTYNAQVENNVSNVEIKATANNGKATISGTGTKSLKVGNNSFIITVIAENGDSKNYVIIINRKAKASEKNETVENKLSSNNCLDSITIDGIYFVYDKDILDYNLFVDNNITNINLHYETSSDKATVTMSGITELEIGLNVIDLIVVAENGDVKTYTLNITRRPERLVAENNDEEILGLINSDSYDDIYVIEKQINAPYIISNEVISALKDSGKSLIYEIIDDETILYQVKFVGGELEKTDDFKFEVLFETTDLQKLESIINSEKYLPIRFNIKGDIQKGIYLHLYAVAKNVIDIDNLKLYEFDNKTNKLDLISNDLNINENVISLGIDDLTKKYILTNNVGKKISNEVIAKENNINFPVIISVFAFLILIIVLIVIKKLKTKKQSNSNIEIKTDLYNVYNQTVNDVDSLENTNNDIK